MNAPITPLALAQQKLAQMKADGIEVERLNPVEKALADPKSRTKAIRAACYECLGGEECPNIRREIGRCTDFGCGLWHLRPYRKGETETDGTPFGLAQREAALGAFEPRSAIGIAMLATAQNLNSPAAAIRGRCVRCQGNRADVTSCRANFGEPRTGESRYLGCALHPVRPYRPGQYESGAQIEAEVEAESDIESMQ